MTRLLRLVLAAFLALAVPLQGLAGATMASCSGAHGQAALAPGGAHDHAAMGHEAAGHTHHAAMGHAHAGEEPAADRHEGHNCAACAACCNLSAAPVPALAVASPDRPSSIAIPFFGTAHASAQARGLERPPSIALLG